VQVEVIAILDRGAVNFGNKAARHRERRAI
jgi:hypothetical protein